MHMYVCILCVTICVIMCAYYVCYYIMCVCVTVVTAESGSGSIYTSYVAIAILRACYPSPTIINMHISFKIKSIYAD